MVYENIRISPEIKNTNDALKRAQVLIRMHKDVVDQQTKLVAAVNEIEERPSGCPSKSVTTQSAIDEAVKLISEQMKSCYSSEASSYACGVREKNVYRRSEGRGLKKVTCFECHGEGHYEEDCSRNSKHVSEKKFAFHQITRNVQAIANIGGVECKVMFDSSSTTSLLSDEIAKKIPHCKWKPVSHSLVTASGNVMDILAAVELEICIKNLQVLTHLS